MIRGILLGTAWGLMLGGGFLVAMSLLFPPARPPAPETVTQTSDLAETDPISEPSGDQTPKVPAPLSEPDRHDAPKVTAPEPAPSRMSSADLDPGTAPEMTAPDAQLGQGPGMAVTGLNAPAPETAILPSPLAVAPEEKPTPADAELDEAAKPNVLRAQDGETVTGFPMGDLGATAQAPPALPVELAEAPVSEDQAGPTPEPEQDPAQDPAPQSQPDEMPGESAKPEAAPSDHGQADKADPAAVQVEPATADPQPNPTPPTTTMPGSPGIRLTEDSPVETPEPAAESAPPTEEPKARPIDRYAADFDNAQGRPILSIVLLDSPKDGATGTLPENFPYPVSVAISVEDAEAEAKMRRYRAAGHEVLALADLPAGARPQDIETLAPAWVRALPEAVAIMERPPNGLQSDRANGEQLAEILSETGHGLLLFPEGLNTTLSHALRRDVPAAAVFRDLDAAGQGQAVIRRFLDNSAFKAGLEGTVILVARLRPETIEALLVWGLADRAGRVALAPVSAALKAAGQ